MQTSLFVKSLKRSNKCSVVAITIFPSKVQIHTSIYVLGYILLPRVIIRQIYKKRTVYTEIIMLLIVALHTESQVEAIMLYMTYFLMLLYSGSKISMKSND